MVKKTMQKPMKKSGIPKLAENIRSAATMKKTKKTMPMMKTMR
jgi:hypothetical protein